MYIILLKQCNEIQNHLRMLNETDWYEKIKNTYHHSKNCKVFIANNDNNNNNNNHRIKNIKKTALGQKEYQILLKL